MSTVKKRILKHYDKWKKGDVNLMEVAVMAKTNKKYASQVLNLHTMYKKESKNSDIRYKQLDSEDAEEFYNPENTIKHIDIIYHKKRIELKIKSKL